MRKYWWLVGLALALVVVGLSPLASSDPDGLERVAEDHGFMEKAASPWYEAIPNYLFPGIADGGASTIVAGVIGVLIVFGVVYGVGKLASRRRSSAS